VRKLKIERIVGERREEVEDRITEEITLRLLAEHRRIAELMCSPGDLEDLVRGFFFTNGFIGAADQIRKVVINRATWTAFIELAAEIDVSTFRLGGVIGSACGSAVPLDGEQEDDGPEAGEAPVSVRVVGTTQRVSAGQIGALMEEFRSLSELHRQTGGVHAAALADQLRLLVFREDIGRHNAVDKAIGAYLLRGDSFSDKLLLTSGRLSSEILHKASACGLPIVVSRSAPTDRCVALARERGITLIGFARGRRMNLYSHGERIVCGQL
jgi:FdhD protein